MVDNSILQIVRMVDRSVVINTFQSSNNFILDCIPSEYTSFTNDMDYNFFAYCLRPSVQSKYKLETL
jgi:ubiquitin C-terminal hydrolase